jgi:hypothetical protein
MTRRRVCAMLPALLPALLVAVSASAAEDMLKVIPEDALAFVGVHRLGEVDAKLQGLAKDAKRPPVSVLGLLKARIGVDKGLDEKGTVAAVALPG